MFRRVTASVDRFVRDGLSGFVGDGVPVPRKNTRSVLRWDASHPAEVNENINLGYSQDQGYS